MIIEELEISNPRVEVYASNVKIKPGRKSILFEVSKRIIDDLGEINQIRTIEPVKRNLEDVKDEVVNVEGVEISAYQISEALKLFFAKFYEEDKAGVVIEENI